jgi:dTDP-4-dehydrorhamnose reductase
MNVLVLGDGLLGSEIVKQTGWDCISRKKDNFDITSCDFNFHGYDVIVNCIAYTNTYSNDKESNWEVNYKAVANLVDYCNNFNIKLIHISTDYVYTNSVSNASENDIPIHGNNWYTYTKLLADGYIELKSKNYLIIRESHKPNPFPYDSAWINQVGNFDYVNKIANIIIQLIKLDENGIINVGTELKTIYDLALETNKNVKSVLKPECAPKDVSLNLTKLKNILNERNNNISI